VDLTEVNINNEINEGLIKAEETLLEIEEVINNEQKNKKPIDLSRIDDLNIDQLDLLSDTPSLNHESLDLLALLNPIVEIETALPKEDSKEKEMRSYKKLEAILIAIPLLFLILKIKQIIQETSPHINFGKSTLYIVPSKIKNKKCHFRVPTGSFSSQNKYMI
jgi:hypothetical protein